MRKLPRLNDRKSVYINNINRLAIVQPLDYKSFGTVQIPSFKRIGVYNRQSNLPIKISSVRKLVEFFLREKKVACQEVAIYFVGIRKITQLHADHFQDPTPTDCITFPLDQDFLGEIFVCPKAALDYNPKHPYEETTLYIIHGLLHLLGYDDIDSKKRARMRKEEKRLMALAKKHHLLVKD